MDRAVVAHDDDHVSFTATDRWLIAGVDGSPHGAAVAHVAAQLARRLSLKVILVHAIGGPAARTELVGERRLDHIDAGRAVLDAISRQVGGEDLITTRLVFGAATEQLTNLVTELDAELVVTGSRGYGPLRAALAGSVSRRLMATDVPVVVVPPEVDTSWELGSTLVCGVSAEDSSEAAIEYAAELAARLEASLTLLHARTLSVTRLPDTATTAGEYIDAMAKIEETAAQELLHDRVPLAQAAPHVDPAFAVGGPVRRLQEAAYREHAGLLVVGSRRHGALRSFVAGSVSGRLAAHSQVPVVIVPSTRPREHAAA